MIYYDNDRFLVSRRRTTTGHGLAVGFAIGLSFFIGALTYFLVQGEAENYCKLHRKEESDGRVTTHLEVIFVSLTDNVRHSPFFHSRCRQEFALVDCRHDVGSPVGRFQLLVGKRRPQLPLSFL